MYYQNSRQSRFSGVHLVLEVFQDTWHSNKENRSVHWNATLSRPLIAANYVICIVFQSHADLVLDADHSWSFLGTQEAQCQGPLSRVAQEPNRNRKPEPSEPFFPKPKVEPEPPESFSRNRNRNRNSPSLLNCTETQKTPFCRGAARTETQNRWNPSTPKP